MIQLDYLLLLWSNEPQVVLDFVVNTAVVDVNAVVRGIEQIAKQCHSPAFLLKTNLRAFGGFLNFRDGVFPAFQQDFQLCIEFGSLFAFSHRTHDDTEVLRLDALDELFQSATLLATLNLC